MSVELSSWESTLLPLTVMPAVTSAVDDAVLLAAVMAIPVVVGVLGVAERCMMGPLPLADM